MAKVNRNLNGYSDKQLTTREKIIPGLETESIVINSSSLNYPATYSLVCGLFSNLLCVRFSVVQEQFLEVLLDKMWYLVRLTDLVHEEITNFSVLYPQITHGHCWRRMVVTLAKNLISGAVINALAIAPGFTECMSPILPFEVDGRCPGLNQTANALTCQVSIAFS